MHAWDGLKSLSLWTHCKGYPSRHDRRNPASIACRRSAAIGRSATITAGQRCLGEILTFGLSWVTDCVTPAVKVDKNLYDLPPEEESNIAEVCYSLDQALDALDQDREFLKGGGVFSDDLIDAYIELKSADVTQLRMTTHPVEFELYYSL